MGDTVKMMDNSELLELLSSDIRKMNLKAKVHGIFDADAVFILTAVKRCIFSVIIVVSIV